MTSSHSFDTDFTLEGTSEPITLTNLRGKPVVLVFYPKNNTPVCTSQLSLYNEVLPLFQRKNAVILGISVDSPQSHQEFKDKLNLRFDLLSDDEPKGNISKKFGVFDEVKNQSKRALFVLDEKGKIYWSEISPNHINPGADGILKALEGLSSSKNS